MDLTPQNFTGASNHKAGGVQATIMTDLNDFLSKVPPGETVNVLSETSKFLMGLCSASGNVVAQRVAEFNQKVEVDPVTA